MNTKSKKRNAQQRQENKKAARKLESKRKRVRRSAILSTKAGEQRKAWRLFQEAYKAEMEKAAKAAAKKAAKEAAEKTIETEAVVKEEVKAEETK